MVKDILSWLDYSVFAESALVLFLMVFAGVSFAMAKMTREWSGRCAAIPLSEGEPALDRKIGSEFKETAEQV